MIERQRIRVQGVVQGVGFRPFVYGLATRAGLAGYVLNDSTGVTIEVEGESPALGTFVEALRSEAPPLAVVEQVAVERLAPCGGGQGFAIAHSQRSSSANTFVSPDMGICDDCLRELFDPADRRYRYPFINCTNCGPRFTITRDVPYDRPLTTMAAFRMCPACEAEYDDPADRRFHAQPNACPECGPRVRLVKNERLENGDFDSLISALDDPLERAQRLFSAGAILAVKGLGGYHLACDALNPEAVARLRERKQRWDKPFALMVPDLAAAHALAHLSSAEAALLTARQRPIVLLAARSPQPVAPQVAPGQHTLGVMLAYSPLHYVLLDAFGRTRPPGLPLALVMTSANPGDEPIVFRDDALDRLAGLADFVLTHDREIHVRCDDSVVRVIGDQLPVISEQLSVTDRSAANLQSPIPNHRPLVTDHRPPPTDPWPVFIRRARGYAPQPLHLPLAFRRPVLAVGAHLKNSICLARGRHAFLSPHLGDLDNLETLAAFRDAIAHFQRLFDLQPELIAHDLHPGYLSTQWAQEHTAGQQGSEGAGDGPRLVPVQHHHAHIASVIAEHGLSGPVIGVAFDGTGLGPDGTLWGGEFLIADLRGFQRAIHLAPIPLPGGEQAIRQPWRLAAAWLQQLYPDAWLAWPLPFVHQLDRPAWAALRQMIDRRLNCPATTSVGRLFDAVAALLGVRQAVSYEGQAASELEALAARAGPSELDAYPFDLHGPVADPAPLFDRLLADLRAATPTPVIAARFHNSLAGLVAQACARLRQAHQINQVALSGGVFQNARLLAAARQRLAGLGFDVFTNLRVPPNDGGLALGQAAIAAAE